MLQEIFTPSTRAVVYRLYAVVGLLLGATQVGFSSADVGQPTALTVALAVFAFIGTGLGFTASANTSNIAEYVTKDGSVVAGPGNDLVPEGAIVRVEGEPDSEQYNDCALHDHGEDVAENTD